MFTHNINDHQQVVRFRILVCVFFFALALPLAIVVYYGFQKFENETYLNYRSQAANALVQVNRYIGKRLTKEQLRPSSHYNFYISGDVSHPVRSSQLIMQDWDQGLSPLANPQTPHYLYDLFGLVGYFNISSQGKLNTPLLPYTTQAEMATANTRLNRQEVGRRLQIHSNVQQILNDNGLLALAQSKPQQGSRGATGLTQGGESQDGGALGPLEKSLADSQRVSPSAPNIGSHSAGLQILQPSFQPTYQPTAQPSHQPSFQPYISQKLKQEISSSSKAKVEPFKLIETDQQQLIFYRTARTGQDLSTQGFIVDEKAFLYDLIGLSVRRFGFDSAVQVQLNSKDEGEGQFFQYSLDALGQAEVVLSQQRNALLAKKTLYQGQLISPFQGMSLDFTTDQLPLGAAANFVLFFVVLLTLVMIAGCLGFYWLGIKQIALAEQRMNFVSSVSHELKTPLTSILMYSQMLKSGMVTSADTMLEYYNFIYFESERLSRLINNVLQLSDLSRHKEVINLEYVGLETLQDIIASKISTLIDKHDFDLHFNLDSDIPDEFEACVDLDAFVQIVINLVDNAVKFYNGAKIKDVSRQKIDIGFSRVKNAPEKLRFSIRDFGPGISSAQRDKIFELFYRCGNELTRTTSGTGIGLALVNELVHAQGGEILVKAEQPGVSFEIIFDARLNDEVT